MSPSWLSCGSRVLFAYTNRQCSREVEPLVVIYQPRLYGERIMWSFCKTITTIWLEFVREMAHFAFESTVCDFHRRMHLGIMQVSNVAASSSLITWVRLSAYNKVSSLDIASFCTSGSHETESQLLPGAFVCHWAHNRHKYVEKEPQLLPTMPLP